VPARLRSALTPFDSIHILMPRRICSASEMPSRSRISLSASFKSSGRTNVNVFCVVGVIDGDNYRFVNLCQFLPDVGDRVVRKPDLSEGFSSLLLQISCRDPQSRITRFSHNPVSGCPYPMRPPLTRPQRYLAA
jgi:hypothetical protein